MFRLSLVWSAYLIALSLLGVPTQLFAAPVNFSGPYTVTAHTSDPGLVINTQILSSPLNFTLSQTQSTGFIPLFDIWTNETAVNADDTVPYPISVTFNFTPTTTPNTVSGSTVGTSSFFGIVQQGVLTWSDPVDFAFGSGGLLRVWLTDENFNTGLFGLTPGEHKGATVDAKFKLISEPSPVPVPAAFPLLAGGLGAMAWWARRRNKQTALTT